MVLVSVLCNWFTAIKLYHIKNGAALLFRMREVQGSNFGIPDVVLIHKICFTHTIDVHSLKMTRRGSKLVGDIMF